MQMTEITITEADRSYIRRAQEQGLRLHEEGAVRIVGTGALVRDGGLTYHADAEGCTCSPHEERRAHACEHMWSWHFEVEQPQETAA